MYKKEDLRFLNMNTTVAIGDKKVFEIEHELSIEEKVKFIDEIKDGIATYLLNILNKWNDEKDSLPKDNYNSIKTVSKKAWIKRNDERKIIDFDYKIGTYYMFGQKYKSMTLICPATEYGHRMLYTDENIVNQWYHDLCCELYNKEREYFESIDTFHIKLDKVQKYAERYHVYFNNDKLNDIVWNRDKDVTEKELDIYLESYIKLENYINDITKEVKGQIDNL